MVSDLSSDERDLWLASVEDRDAESFTPSTGWTHGGLIIEHKNIGLVPFFNFGCPDAPYLAYIYRPRDGVGVAAQGLILLIATVRCYTEFRFRSDLYERS
jgi:hypothetical protein